jgi:methyl-accepting chemotaxis protein
MKERRRLWQIKFTCRFLNIALVIATILTLISLFVVVRFATDFQCSLVQRINLIILQVCFAGVIFTFLTTIFMLVRYGLGPLGRIEKILDQVLNGDYTQRITLRKKDLLASFAAKLNKVIELLEQKAKG